MYDRLLNDDAMGEIRHKAGGHVIMYTCIDYLMMMQWAEVRAAVMPWWSPSTSTSCSRALVSSRSS